MVSHSYLLVLDLGLNDGSWPYGKCFVRYSQNLSGVFSAFCRILFVFKRILVPGEIFYRNLQYYPVVLFGLENCGVVVNFNPFERILAWWFDKFMFEKFAIFWLLTFILCHRVSWNLLATSKILFLDLLFVVSWCESKFLPLLSDLSKEFSLVWGLGCRRSILKGFLLFWCLG